MPASTTTEQTTVYSVGTDESGKITTYRVHADGPRKTVLLGQCADAKEAQALAGTFAHAGLSASEALEIVPPANEVDSASPIEWERWAAETNAVPAEIAAGGKKATAGWISVIHGLDPDTAADRLGISKSTFYQYMSDLRTGF
jgi:hypothetical protein